MITPVVIYHADCWDGVTAALCAWYHFQDGATYVPMAYGDHTPWERYAGCDVYFVDFSWPRFALEALATVANKVVVLDHHKNMGEQLMAISRHAPGRCEIEVVFNNEKSGARLSLERFPNLVSGCKILVDYVEDRDLWHRKLPWSREFTAALNTYPKTIRGAMQAVDFLTWDGMEDLADVGTRVLAYQEAMVESLCKEASVRTFAGIDGIPVCCVPQGTGLQSEAAEYLATTVFPGVPFAAVYGDLASGHRRWSMRSRKLDDGTTFDVSAIARRYGGNGHLAAAGFRLPAGVWPE